MMRSAFVSPCSLASNIARGGRGRRAGLVGFFFTRRGPVGPSLRAMHFTTSESGGLLRSKLLRASTGCHLQTRRFCVAPAGTQEEQARLVDDVEASVRRFRLQLGPDLLNASPKGPLGELSARCRRLAEEEVSLRGSGFADGGVALVAAMRDEAEVAITPLDTLQSLTLERKQLQARRADLLAVGFQSCMSENKEFAALVVCATAGIFAVSIHYVFFSIFAVAYYLYRRATQEIRHQRKSVADLQVTLDRLRAIGAEETQALARLSAIAIAWSEGRAALHAAPESTAE